MKILFFALFFTSLNLNAQDVRLETLTVTGTRSAKYNSDAPIKTEVITQEEFKEKNYNNAAEAIKDVSGLMLVSNYGKAGLVPVIQGLSSEHVLVLIDGTPQTPNGGSGFDLSSIHLSDIEKIEIVKGASSVLYGSSALGGVINIITKKQKNNLSFNIKKNYYFETKPDKKDPYNNLSLNFSKAFEKLSYKFGIGHTLEKAIDRDASTDRKDTEDRETLNTSIGIEAKLNQKNKLSFDYNRLDEKNREYDVDASVSPIEKLHHDGIVKKNSFKLKHEYNHNNSDFESYVFFENILDEFKINDKVATSYPESITKYDYTNLKGETLYRNAYNSYNILTLGAYYSKETLDGTLRSQTNPTTVKKSKEVDNKFTEVVDIYAQNDYIYNDYEIISGVRYSFDRHYKENISPKINLSKNIDLKNDDKIILRTSIGTGYKIPTIKQLYYDKKGFYTVSGNQNLKAETATSYQLGADYFKGQSFYFGLNGFYNKVNRLITLKKITSSEYTYKNTKSSSILGGELSTGFNINKKFFSDTSLTYTRAVDDETGKIITERPFVLGKQQFKFKLSDNLQTLYIVNYYGHSFSDEKNREEYKPYATQDLHLIYNLSKNADLSVGINNIFNDVANPLSDEEDLVKDNRPAIGRIGFVSLNVSY